MPRQVIYTIEDPVAGDIASVTFSRPNGVVSWSANYNLRNDSGGIAASGTVGQAATAGQITALNTFINTHVIPLVESVEEL